MSLSLVQCERKTAGGSGIDAREGGGAFEEHYDLVSTLPVLNEEREKQVWPVKEDETVLGGFTGNQVQADVEREWDRVIKEEGEQRFKQIVQELAAEGQRLRKEVESIRAGAFQDPKARRDFAERLTELNEVEQLHANAKAKLLGLKVAGQGNSGQTFEILRFDENGYPVYRTTHNENAAISNAANLVGAGTVYDLTGAGLRVGVWDDASVRATHQEFGGRAVQVDAGGAYLSSHQTHVSGTIGAAGVNSKARGMAVEVEIRNHEWNNDLAEMTVEAAATPSELSMLSVSNHSYGFLMGWEYGNYSGQVGYHFFGDFSMNEDADFGKYTSEASLIDDICNGSPYYLPFWAAGNDRNDGPAEGSLIYYWNGSSWQQITYNSAVHPDAEYSLEYDTIGGSAVAKNIMTIGALNDAVAGGVRSLEAGTMSSFSSWGPADDGRIKPDIVANGVDLFSADSTRNNGYANKSGTSMATPSATGAAILVQERYGERFGGELMRSSLLKALIIHTADDLGRAGPDYSNGWGLMNVKESVDLIDYHYAHPSNQHLLISSVSLGTPTQTYRFLWDQTSSVMKATICWTDPAGNVADGILDSSTPALVNDLDIRITSPSGVTLMPWVLDKDSPTDLAHPGDNTVDNVEQIVVTDPEPGEYILTVSYKGSITGPSQLFSLVTTGQAQAGVGVFPGNLAMSRGVAGQLASPSEHDFRVVNNTGSDAAWSVSCDSTWLSLSQISGIAVAGGQSIIDASLTPESLDMTPGTYNATLVFSGSGFASDFERDVQLTIYPIVPPTELFSLGDGFDLKKTQLTFLPSANGYAVFKKAVVDFPVDVQVEAEMLSSVTPTAGNSDDGHWTRSMSSPVIFFGQTVQNINIGTNGLVRFGENAYDYTESVEEHYANLGISVLWDDLNPASNGAVYYQDFPGVKVVVTYEDVPEYGSSEGNSAQLEIFTDGSGIIRLTYLNVNSVDSLVGLSDGQGVPAGWPSPEADFSDSYDYPSLEFTMLGDTIREGDGTLVTITASLSAKPPVPLVFPLRLLGSAELNDLTGMPESLVFPVFEPVQTYEVQAVDEDLIESTELMEIQVQTHPLVDFVGSLGLTILDASNLPDALAHWKLDELSETEDANDSTGNGNHASASGIGMSVVDGKLNKARYLDGDEGCFTFGAFGEMGNQVTITGWVKRDGEQINGTGLIFHRFEGNLHGLQLGSQMDLRYHWNTSDEMEAWSSDLIVPDQTWTFVALVIEPESASIFMHDGINMQIATTSVSHGSATWSGMGHLGCDPVANRRFKGALDDCRVYRHALSARDIEFVYREGLSSVEQYAYDSGVEAQSLSAELDPDLDGLPNLLELALATNPNAPDNPVRFEFVDGKMKLIFEQMNEELVQVEGEWSDDMVIWHTSGFTVNEDGVEIVMDSDCKFVRLKATEITP